MRKIIFIVLSLSYLFGLDVYSGGELSDNQKAIDVTHYDINLKVDPNRKVILGKVEITFLLKEQPKNFEFDLIGDLPEPDYEGMVVGPKHPCKIRYKRRDRKKNGLMKSPSTMSKSFKA